MSILKILENSNVNPEEFQFLVDLLKRTKKDSENSIKKFDDAEIMLKAIALIHPAFVKEGEVADIKSQAEKALTRIKEELLLLDSLIKKLDL
jgi:hypothetical protein